MLMLTSDILPSPQRKLPSRRRAPSQAIGYVRVSTRRQGDKGIGLEAQQAQISAFARRANIVIVEWFGEAHSAMGPAAGRSRPVWDSACRRARELGVPIVVASLDRVSRHTRSLEALVRQNELKIISAEDGGRAVSAVLEAKAARAQYEGEKIAELTRAALQAKKQEGMLLGNRTNLPEAQQRGAAANRRAAERRAADLLESVREIRAAGASTAADIARALNDRGIRTARGEQWNSGNIRRLLRRIKTTEEVPNNPDWGMF
jgi:DNA invertase Pin-like site-specific DNA recombinase